MYLGAGFPNFFLPIGRVFGAEIPVTRRGRPNGSVLMTGQFKRMTPELREQIVDLLADARVVDLRAHPPEKRAEAPEERKERPARKEPRQRKPRAAS